MKKKILAILSIVASMSLMGACSFFEEDSSNSEQNSNSSTPTHTWATEWSKDEAKHWKECTDDACEEKSEEAVHSGGTATLTEKAKCSVCGQEYGELLTENWTVGTYPNTICVNTNVTIPTVSLTYAGAEVAADDIEMEVKFEGQSIDLTQYPTSPMAGTVEVIWSYLDAEKTIEIEFVDHTPNADDGDCTTAITCANCPTVTTEAKTEHVAKADDGDCTTAITCANCPTVMTEGNDAHTPNADDDDCTTAITCANCPTVTTEAKTEHVAKADDGDMTTAVTCEYCPTVMIAAISWDEINYDFASSDDKDAFLAKSYNGGTVNGIVADTNAKDGFALHATTSLNMSAASGVQILFNNIDVSEYVKIVLRLRTSDSVCIDINGEYKKYGKYETYTEIDLKEYIAAGTLNSVEIDRQSVGDINIWIDSITFEEPEVFADGQEVVLFAATTDGTNGWTGAESATYAEETAVKIQTAGAGWSGSKTADCFTPSKTIAIKNVKAIKIRLNMSCSTMRLYTSNPDNFDNESGGKWSYLTVNPTDGWADVTITLTDNTSVESALSGIYLFSYGGTAEDIYVSQISIIYQA